MHIGHHKCHICYPFGFGPLFGQLCHGERDVQHDDEQLREADG